MKTITIANQKGGVGKTTIAFHQAIHLAKNGKRVVMIDFDPQANSTRRFLGDVPENPEGLCASSMMVNDDENRKPIETKYGVDFICADQGLTHPSVSGMLPGDVINNIRESFKKIESDYDICIMDTGPSLGAIMVGAISISDFLLVPIQPESISIEGVAALLKTIKTVNPGLITKKGGVAFVLNKVKWFDQLHIEMMKQIKKAYGDLVLNEVLTDRVAINYAMNQYGKPVWDIGREYRSQSQVLASKEMQLLTTAIERRAA